MIDLFIYSNMFKKATQIIATEDEQDSQAPCALIAAMLSSFKPQFVYHVVPWQLCPVEAWLSEHRQSSCGDRSPISGRRRQLYSSSHRPYAAIRLISHWPSRHPRWPVPWPPTLSSLLSYPLWSIASVTFTNLLPSHQRCADSTLIRHSVMNKEWKSLFAWIELLATEKINRKSTNAQYVRDNVMLM